MAASTIFLCPFSNTKRTQVSPREPHCLNTPAVTTRPDGRRRNECDASAARVSSLQLQPWLRAHRAVSHWPLCT